MRLLDSIVELQGTYDELTVAEAQIAGVPDWMEELHAEHSTASAQIEAIETEAEEARHQEREADAAVADADVRLKAYQDQIGLVRNQREYSALLQEIDTVKATIRELEATIADARERLAAHEEAIEQAREAFQDLDDRYQTELAKWEAQKPEVAQRVDELRQRAETLRQKLPRPILARYDLIYERYSGQALAEVREVTRTGRAPQMWHCSACHYRIRPQTVVQLRNDGSIASCDSCRRILCLPDEVEV